MHAHVMHVTIILEEQEIKKPLEPQFHRAVWLLFFYDFNA